jgi:hypothetical protein
MNDIKIIVTDKYVPGTGFSTARLKAKQAGEQVGKDFDEAVVKATSGTGRKVSEQLEPGLKTGNKELDRLQAQALKLNSAFDTLNDKHVLSKADFKSALDGFSQVDASIRTTTKDLDGLHAQALKLNNVFDTANDKNLLSDADMKSMTERFKGIEEEAKASGQRTAHNFNTNMKHSFDDSNNGIDNILKAGLVGAAGTIAASGGVFGITLGAAVIGGLATALAGGGVVGLAGLLLKDNEKVSKAWGKTWELITEDAKRRAGFMEDEFVAGAGRTAEAWSNKLGPALERIFIDAQPLVDDFIDMPTNWLMALEPGIEKAVKNAGPAVEGLDRMGQAIFKGFGDGLADMSENSEDFKTAMVMAGDAIGGGLKGALGTMGDMAEWFADNKASVENFGRTANAVFAEIGKNAGLLADETAAIFSPSGKNAKGDDWWSSFQKMMMGDDYKPPVKGDYNDARNLGELGNNVGNAVGRAGNNLGDLVMGREQSSSTKPVEGSNLDSMLHLLQVRKDMNTELDKLNYLNSIGLNQSQAAIDANLGLSASQSQLIADGSQLTTVTGNNTAANQAYIDAINRMSAAGVPASESLLNTVAGMNSAELAALGATVTMDGLGNAIIAIPGQKDVVVNAATIPAQDAIAAVQGAVNSLVGKTIIIGVHTQYSYSGSSGAGSVNGQTTFHDQYAHGGITSTAATGGARGGDVVMNERGAEAVRLPSGSTVMPAGATRALEQRWAEGGGGGGGLAISFDTTGIDDRSFLSAFIGMLRFNGKKVPDLTAPRVA